MARLTTTLLLGTALMAIAACTPKRVEPLPQAPVGATSSTTAAPQAATGSTITPGSAEDFKRSVTSDTINFDLDQFDIDAQARAILDTQATWLTQYPDVRITLEGHCDERGTREYNLALGDRRANAAKNYLAARGIAASRITTISYGKERPLALGSDEASWAQNRRAVTITLQ